VRCLCIFVSTDETGSHQYVAIYAKAFANGLTGANPASTAAPNSTQMNKPADRLGHPIMTRNDQPLPVKE
jgi:hypothetical protein